MCTGIVYSINMSAGLYFHFMPKINGPQHILLRFGQAGDIEHWTRKCLSHCYPAYSCKFWNNAPPKIHGLARMETPEFLPCCEVLTEWYIRVRILFSRFHLVLRYRGTGCMKRVRNASLHFVTMLLQRRGICFTSTILFTGYGMEPSLANRIKTKASYINVDTLHPSTVTLQSWPYHRVEHAR